jgi:hypothetical protein
MPTVRVARERRDHERRRRALSNGSINKVLAAIRRVLKEGVRSRLMEHTPTGRSRLERKLFEQEAPMVRTLTW